MFIDYNRLTTICMIANRGIIVLETWENARCICYFRFEAMR